MDWMRLLADLTDIAETLLSHQAAAGQAMKQGGPGDVQAAGMANQQIAGLVTQVMSLASAIRGRVAPPGVPPTGGQGGGK